MKPRIIFLSKRVLSLHPLSWVSNLIAFFTKSDITHTATVYYRNNVPYVREMGFWGVSRMPYENYIKKYEKRIFGIKIIENFANFEKYNYACDNYFTRYDYTSLFMQIIESIFVNFTWKNTEYKRTCSEDSARMINILNPEFFKNPETETPVSLYEKL